VPVFSHVSVAGERVTLAAGEPAAALEFVRGWYHRHVALDSRRSSTWTSGAGVARMVAALRGGGDVYAASVRLDGEYGISGVSLGVPIRLGPGGVEAVHEWELDAEELAGLQRAADVIRAAAA
jgi:malate dehydrogenase